MLRAGTDTTGTEAAVPPETGPAQNRTGPAQNGYRYVREHPADAPAARAARRVQAPRRMRCTP